LQVAALAGVPKEVIRRAQSYLKTLESLQAVHVDSPQGQLAFTAEEPEIDDALRDALDELDPDAMTPREALAALYRLKDL
jgi:DNA mismatch repair protein MutS